MDLFQSYGTPDYFLIFRELFFRELMRSKILNENTSVEVKFCLILCHIMVNNCIGKRSLPTSRMTFFRGIMHRAEFFFHLKGKNKIKDFDTSLVQDNKDYS